MPRRYSLAYLTVPGLEPAAQVRLASAAGYDAVGLRLIPMGLPGEPNLDVVGDRALREELLRALEETGVAVHDIELAKVADGIDYDAYAPAVRLGAELGAEALLTSVWTDRPSAQLQGLRAVGRLAGDHGMRALAEFVPLASVRTLNAMAELVRAADEPALGLLIDAYHYVRGETRLSDLAAVPADRLPMLHACDCAAAPPADAEELRREVRERRLYVGEGVAPVADIVRALQRDAVIAVEQPNLARQRELGAVGFAASAREHAQRYLAGHGLA